MRDLRYVRGILVSTFVAYFYPIEKYTEKHKNEKQDFSILNLQNFRT